MKFRLISDTKLNSNGIRQSRLVGEALALVEFTHAYSSPQTRAFQVPALRNLLIESRHTTKLSSVMVTLCRNASRMLQFKNIIVEDSKVVPRNRHGLLPNRKG